MDGNRNIINIKNNNNKRAHQEQEEEEPLPQPQITVLLTPEGQKVRSILNTKPDELPLYFINNINELMNDIAAGGEFLPIVRTLVADDLFVRDEQHRQEDEQRAHQQDEEGELLQPRIVLLTPEGQNVRSILAKKPEDLPPCVINKINELMNDIAAAGEFLTKVRTSIVDDLFVRGEQHRREQQQQKRGLMKTIVHKDWKKIEKQYETAFRFFPGVLQERWRGRPLLRMMSMYKKNCNYNLRLVSLIPLIGKLGIKLQQFNAEERGGLLTPIDDVFNVLQFSLWYQRFENTTVASDECFSAVVERLRKENLLVKEDIQRYNLFGQLCSSNVGPFLASRFLYYIDWDPMTLSLPCDPENGNFLPIRWSTTCKDSRNFIFLFKAGMKYFPEKFGFVFCEGTHQQNGKVFCQTPFERACKKYGQENVIKEIMNHIAEYRSITTATTTTPPPSTRTAVTTSTTTTTTTTTELSLLLSAVTDEAIHIDCLYILLRTDITAGLLRLQQHLQQQELEEGDGDGQTVPEINIDNDNIDSNNMEMTGDSTTTSTFMSMLMSTSSLENIAAITAVATVSSPMANKNKNNNSSDDNNNNDKHQQSLTKRKKRKQHEMR